MIVVMLSQQPQFSNKFTVVFDLLWCDRHQPSPQTSGLGLTVVFVCVIYTDTCLPQLGQQLSRAEERITELEVWTNSQV